MTNVRIMDNTTNKKVEWNVLTTDIKDIMRLIVDYVYIYKLQEHKLKIEVIK